MTGVLEATVRAHRSVMSLGELEAAVGFVGLCVQTARDVVDVLAEVLLESRRRDDAVGAFLASFGASLAESLVTTGRGAS